MISHQPHCLVSALCPGDRVVSEGYQHPIDQTCCGRFRQNDFRRDLPNWLSSFFRIMFGVKRQANVGAHYINLAEPTHKFVSYTSCIYQRSAVFEASHSHCLQSGCFYLGGHPHRAHFCRETGSVQRIFGATGAYLFRLWNHTGRPHGMLELLIIPAIVGVVTAFVAYRVMLLVFNS